MKFKANDCVIEQFTNTSDTQTISNQNSTKYSQNNAHLISINVGIEYKKFNIVVILMYSDKTLIDNNSRIYSLTNTVSDV